MKDLSDIYNYLYTNNYGQSGRFRFVNKWLPKFPPPAKWLDVGCGHGKYTLKLEEMGYDVTGVDIIDPNLTEAKNYIKSTGFEYPEVDYIMCLDMLEHLPTEEIPQIIKGFKDACKFAFMTVSHSKAYTKGPNGEQLHLTIKPQDWWTKRFKEGGMEIIHEQHDSMHGMTFYIVKC